ncbi:MAG: hypothetical protein K2Q22_13830, partial [Cytophagales bacterium]|nr:hypothetical protein [Cytophagales bacterium]
EQSTDNNNFATIASTSPNISFSNLGFTWYYRAIVNDPGCADAYSSVATVTAFSASQIGSINYSGNTTVCSGENSGTISLGGITTSVVGWVSSTDNFTNNITSLGTTSSSIVFLNIVTTTSFRGLVQNGVCPIATSPSVTITVIKSDTGFYTTPEPAPACGGTNSGTIVVQPIASSIKGWQSSIDNFVNDITPIANTNTNYSYSNLFNTTYFRAVLQRSNCKVAYSPSFVVAMKDQGVGGKVLGTDVICASTSGLGTLTLSGYSATLIKWESSLDNFATLNAPITTTSPFLTYNSLTQTTWFRAVSTGSSCPLTYSLPAKITIGGTKSIGGKITPKYTQHCSTTNFTNLNLSGYTGNILYWEASGNNFISIYTIPGVVTNPISNLTSVTSYRAVVQGNSCTAAYSDTAVIDATPILDGIYTISPLADSTVCFGSLSPTNLTFSNFFGAITGWEQSSDPLFGSPKTITSVSNTIVFSNLTTTSYFRAKLKNGTCPNIIQKSRMIKVDALSQGGTPTLGATGSLCITTNAGVIKLKNYVGKIQYWGTLQSGIGNSGIDSLFISNLTSNTGYFASIKNGVCLAVPSETLYVTVDSLTKPGVIVNPSNSTICAGINSGTISLTGANGSVVRWEESTNNFSTILNI